MKIAVISDIHGNMNAVEAVMKDIQEQECEQVFVLGDYAMAGPEPLKTIEWFMEKQSDSNFKMIQGNTDLMIANYSEELYSDLKEKAPIMAEALKNDSKIISENARNFLKELPPQIKLNVEGISILLVHGSPRKNNEDILPELTTNNIEEIIDGVEESLILCGHTHIPCGYQTTKQQTVINVGSIGRPFTDKPDSCYLKLTIENGECLFEHRFVRYDRFTAYEKLKARPIVGAEKLANTLLNPKERHF